MSAAPDRPVLSVSEVAGGLKELVETHFDDVWVEGELSNFRRYRSGHCYFSLKDEEAQLRCVMWRGFAEQVFFEPQDGLLVRLHGSASVYPARGELQLVARSLLLAGEGALMRAYEALRGRLEVEGLFDPAHKQRLPAYPEMIGIVTSGDGAALHDILAVLRRRFPQVRVLVCPVRVQGLGAADEIAEAIETFGSLPAGDPFRPDVLIVGRGGGSIEDLWAFNEERVARALHACAIPTISAVGHQTDVSISDFVADDRAATPSMAAELVVPDRRDVALLVRGLAAALQDRVVGDVDLHRQRILSLTRSYTFRSPVEEVRRQQQRLDELTDRLHRNARLQTSAIRKSTEALQNRLLLLDPARPLLRGYARVERDGRPVRQAASLQPNDEITLHFADGARHARVAD